MTTPALQTLPFTFRDLHDSYRSGVQPSDIVAEAFRRIDAVGDPGIFLHLVDRDTAIAAAQQLGSFDPVAKPLWGIPFAIKDNIDSAGLPTTAACPDFAYDAEADAFVVGLLRDAGAILIGKTNLDQFATGLVGIRSPFTLPKNAVDPEIVPGGSSSGSGVAVSHGLVAFALGTDTAGSGRVPAALNNIVGLKPSLGALSASGVVPACRTLDTISIFALTVEDAYAAFQVASVFDPADAYAKHLPARDLGALPPTFTVGVPDAATREFFGDTAQAESFAAALDTLRTLGGEIVELDFSPFYQIAQMLYEGAWVAERYTVVKSLIERDRGALHPATLKVISRAEGLTADNVFNDFYRMADLKRAVEPTLAGFDMFCVPTIPTFYSVQDLEADPIGPNSRLGTYTNFVNLLNMCGIAVPVGPRTDTRPGSVTLLAGAGQDGRIASVASALHRRYSPALGATGWHLPGLDEATPQAAPDEIAVAMVGAHMAGLPLNREVTRLGGRFLRAAATAPDYRLYSLAGGPPRRPGLVRGKDGAAIALEIWTLPVAAFGDFMNGIPQPLGIGSVRLADGNQVKGFLCESAGLEGAEDITSHGGWRAYLASLEDTPDTTSQPETETQYAKT